MEFIFINGWLFYLTKSVNINFKIIQACIYQGKAEIKKGLDLVKKTYKFRGFNIAQYHGDNEFEKIISHLIPSILHICSAYEHIGDIVHAYCTFKE